MWRVTPPQAPHSTPEETQGPRMTRRGTSSPSDVDVSRSGMGLFIAGRGEESVFVITVTFLKILQPAKGVLGVDGEG